MVPNPAKKTTGQATYLSNQVINALGAAAATPARVPLGTLSPDMVRLEAEVKQITHAIRMAAYNAETALARAPARLLRPRRRRGIRAHPRSPHHLRRHLPRPRPAAHPARPAYRTRRTKALATLCDQLSQAQACYPGTDLVLRYEVKSHPNPALKISLCRESWSSANSASCIPRGESERAKNTAMWSGTTSSRMSVTCRSARSTGRSPSTCWSSCFQPRRPRRSRYARRARSSRQCGIWWRLTRARKSACREVSLRDPRGSGLLPSRVGVQRMAQVHLHTISTPSTHSLHPIAGI